MNFRKIRLWISSAIGYAAILVMLITAVFVVVSGKTGKEPFVCGYCIMWVKTGSMSPTIPEKSYILVKKAEPAEVVAGDIIVYISDDPSIVGQRNVHRVVDITEDENGNLSFITKGDNVVTNSMNDVYPAMGEKLIGKHVSVLKFLSIMGRLLANTTGFLIILSLILSILMFIYVPEISKFVKKADEIKKDKEKLMDELVRLEVEKLKAAGGVIENGESVKAAETDQSKDV